MSTHTLPKKSRRRQSEQEAMFQLDSDLPSPPTGKSVHSPSEHHSSYSEKTFPRRKRRINIFNRTSEDGDRNNQILNGSLVRPFRKGNKHKDDYVFVDFEKQNYMNMASNGSNKWKFLNFSSGSKWYVQCRIYIIQIYPRAVDLPAGQSLFQLKVLGIVITFLKIECYLNKNDKRQH